jgi:hypothetical protein
VPRYGQQVTKAASLLKERSPTRVTRISLLSNYQSMTRFLRRHTEVKVRALAANGRVADAGIELAVVVGAIVTSTRPSFSKLTILPTSVTVMDTPPMAIRPSLRTLLRCRPVRLLKRLPRVYRHAILTDWRRVLLQECREGIRRFERGSSRKESRSLLRTSRHHPGAHQV